MHLLFPAATSLRFIYINSSQVEKDPEWLNAYSSLQKPTLGSVCIGTEPQAKLQIIFVCVYWSPGFLVLFVLEKPMSG